MGKWTSRHKGRSALHVLVVVLAVVAVLVIVFWPEPAVNPPGPTGPAKSTAEVFRIPQGVLLGPEFQLQGPDEVVISKGVPELGQVELIVPVKGTTVVGDNWPISRELGVGWDPVLKHWTSLAAYKRYRMTLRYAGGPGALRIRLFMNTGLTGPSARPPNTKANDTLWMGPQQEVAPGRTVELELDFSRAQAFNIEDNPEPHTGADSSVTDGQWTAINTRDLNELSNIGLTLEFVDEVHRGKDVTLVIEGPVSGE